MQQFPDEPPEGVKWGPDKRLTPKQMEDMFASIHKMAPKGLDGKPLMPNIDKFIDEAKQPDKMRLINAAVSAHKQDRETVARLALLHNGIQRAANYNPTTVELDWIDETDETEVHRNEQEIQENKGKSDP